MASVVSTFGKLRKNPEFLKNHTNLNNTIQGLSVAVQKWVLISNEYSTSIIGCHKVPRNKNVFLFTVPFREENLSLRFEVIYLPPIYNQKQRHFPGL